MATLLLEVDDRPIDPYAEWAAITQFRAFYRAQVVPPEFIPFLVELHQPYEPAQPEPPDGGFRLGGLPLQVPPAYDSALPDSGLRVRFITLRLATAGLDPKRLVRAVRRIMADRRVKRIQIGFPRPGHRMRQGSDRDVPSRDPEPDEPWPWPAQARRRVVLGVIEDGMPFAHIGLRMPETDPQDTPRPGLRTRVWSLWDQSTVQLGLEPWQRVPDFGYGRQMRQPGLNALMAQHAQDERQVDEARLYAATWADQQGLVQRGSHAAAVIGLFAGQQAVQPWGPALLGRGAATGGGLRVQAADDSQYDALVGSPVVAVRLPQEQAGIGAGRALPVYAIEALHYLIGEARRLKPDDDAAMPSLVVNLSYGAVAGPHDGHSLVECALAELCAGYHELALVLAAGNSHGTLTDDRPLAAGQRRPSLPSGAHAQQQLPAGGAGSLTLLVPADKRFETYLELWFAVLGQPADQPPDQQRLAQDEVEIVVTPPGGPAWPPVRCGGSHYGSLPGELPSAGLVFVREASQSEGRSMALLVLAPTRIHADYVEARAGRWTLQVRNQGRRALALQAWVERDDAPPPRAQPQRARLVPSDDVGAAQLSDDNLLSNIALVPQGFTVGALLNREDLEAGTWRLRASPYTSAGADAAHGPRLSAVADAAVALFGLRVAGTHSGMVLRANGSSMAAPQAARWIALQMVAGASRADIEARPPVPGVDARRGMTVP